MVQIAFHVSDCVPLQANYVTGTWGQLVIVDGKRGEEWDELITKKLEEKGFGRLHESKWLTTPLMQTNPKEWWDVFPPSFKDLTDYPAWYALMSDQPPCY